jgi:hypothetical protein
MLDFFPKNTLFETTSTGEAVKERSIAVGQAE